MNELKQKAMKQLTKTIRGAVTFALLAGAFIAFSATQQKFINVQRLLTPEYQPLLIAFYVVGGAILLQIIYHIVYFVEIQTNHIKIVEEGTLEHKETERGNKGRTYYICVIDGVRHTVKKIDFDTYNTGDQVSVVRYRFSLQSFLMPRGSIVIPD